jgi:hypothetical protein
MNLTDSGANAILAASVVNGDLLRLLDSTGSVVTGGSYADQPTSWATPASAQILTSADIVFSGMPTVNIAAWELWDSGLTIKKWAGMLEEWSGTSTASDGRVHVPGSGHVDGDMIVFSAAPDGQSPWQIYFIVNSTADDFQVATTSGGSPVTFGSDQPVVFGSCYAITAGDSVTIPAGSADMRFL